MKLVLIVIVIGAGVGTGYLMAKPYDNRLLHLNELIHSLKLLEAEMKYSRDPLPVLLYRLGSKDAGEAGTFFLKVCQGLKGMHAFNFFGSWAGAIEEVYGEGVLNEDDKAVLTQFGAELGKTDMNSQQSLFDRVFSRLEQQAADAEEQKKIKGKMYRSLWTAAGILLAIIAL